MPIERLSKTAARFLAREDAPGAWHIGGLLLVEAPASGEPITLEEVRRHAAARLGADPRLRQRVLFPRHGLGRPIWSDDLDFDLERHVTAEGPGEGGAEGPAPDEDALREIVGDVISAPLDIEHPLWSVTLVSPLADGGAAIVGRFHHSIADGMKGVMLAAALLFDTDPDADPGPPFEWTPEPPPTDRELFDDELRERSERVREAAQRVEHGLPKAAERIHRESGEEPGEAAPPPPPTDSGEPAFETLRRAPGTLRRQWFGPDAPASPLEGELGKRRVAAVTSSPLDEVKRLETAFGEKVTVNDICLSAVAGGVRAWMEAEGGEPADIVAKCPVVPHKQEGGVAQRTGRGSIELITLPVTLDDPVERLLEVGRRTHDTLLQADVDETRSIEAALDHLPHMLAALAEERLASPSHYNVAVTNVPGPPNPFFVAGGAVRTATPLPHLFGEHLLHVGVLSLAGTLTLGFVADPEHLPEPQLLARGAGAEISALLGRA